MSLPLQRFLYCYNSQCSAAETTRPNEINYDFVRKFGMCIMRSRSSTLVLCIETHGRKVFFFKMTRGAHQRLYYASKTMDEKRFFLK